MRYLIQGYGRQSQLYVTRQAGPAGSGTRAADLVASILGRAAGRGSPRRVLVTHVDDGRPDLDAAGLCPDRRKERERSGELAGEVTDREIGAVGAEFLGRNGGLN